MNEIIWTYANTNGVLIYYGDDYIYDALGITKYIAITVFYPLCPRVISSQLKVHASIIHSM